MQFENPKLYHPKWISLVKIDKGFIGNPPRRYLAQCYQCFVLHICNILLNRFYVTLWIYHSTIQSRKLLCNGDIIIDNIEPMLKFTKFDFCYFSHLLALLQLKLLEEKTVIPQFGESQLQLCQARLLYFSTKVVQG